MAPSLIPSPNERPRRDNILNQEDRLTIPHAGHERKHTQYGYTAYWTQASKFDMMNRLGEYEDTGLTPEEIKTLIDNATRLTREG